MTIDEILSLIPVILTRLDAIESQQHEMQGGINRVLGMLLGDAKRDKVMSASMDELKAAVAANKDATASAVQLIEGLADQLREAVGDDEAVASIAAELKATAQSLGKAVTDNTPFAPSQQ